MKQKTNQTMRDVALSFTPSFMHSPVHKHRTRHIYSDLYILRFGLCLSQYLLDISAAALGKYNNNHLDYGIICRIILCHTCHPLLFKYSPWTSTSILSIYLYHMRSPAGIPLTWDWNQHRDGRGRRRKKDKSKIFLLAKRQNILFYGHLLILLFLALKSPLLLNKK